MRKNHGVFKPNGSPYWYASFQVGGRRFNGSTKLTNRTEAIAFSKRWKEEEKTKLLVLGKARGRDMTVLAAVDRLVREKVRENGKSPYREKDLDWIVKALGPDTMLSEIDAGVVSELVEERGLMYRFDNPNCGLVKPGTITNSVLRPLSGMLHKARDEWGIPLPDMPKVSNYFSEPYARTRELSIREEIALMPNLGDYRALVEFILRSGLRRESALLRRRDVHLEEGYIRVLTKGNKLVEIPITPPIRAILEANINNPTEFVFTYRKATKAGVEVKPITASGFYSAFKEAARKAGVADLVIHDLRRTAGARMYRATGNLGAVSKFLGHANILITQRHYVHISPQDVSIAMLATEAAYQILMDKAVAGMTMH